MIICSNCKAEVARSKIIWAEDGTKREECPNCAPENFEKFTAPSDKVPWMGWEAHPNEYEKKYDKDGLIYERKPEYRAEQEQRLMCETEDERVIRERAEAKKRKERRTTPMDAAELAQALHKAEEIANWVQGAAAQGTDVN